MSILVTGGAGYIGSHMCWHLQDHGFESLIALDNLRTGRPEFLPEGVSLISCDLQFIDDIRNLFERHEITTIFHFAAATVVPESVHDPIFYYKNNTIASYNLFSLAAEFGVEQIIFSSTAAVYGDVGEEPVMETAELRPISPYGGSKMAAELILKDIATATGMRYAILRYFNVAGADPDGRTGQSTPNATHLIKLACRAAMPGNCQLRIYGTNYPTPDGTGVRDYIHVADLVDIHRRIWQHLVVGGASGTWNCGYNRGYSVREIIDAVERVAKRRIVTSEEARRDGDSASVIANTTKLRITLDWVPAYHDIDMIIDHALNWEKRLC